MSYFQEFHGKMEIFIDTYELKAKEPLDPKKILDYLEQELKNKRTQLITEAFSHLSVTQIIDAIEVIKDMFPNENHSQLKKKGKKNDTRNA